MHFVQRQSGACYQYPPWCLVVKFGCLGGEIHRKTVFMPGTIRILAHSVYMCSTSVECLISMTPLPWCCGPAR